MGWVEVAFSAKVAVSAKMVEGEAVMAEVALSAKVVEGAAQAAAVIQADQEAAGLVAEVAVVLAVSVDLEAGEAVVEMTAVVEMVAAVVAEGSGYCRCQQHRCHRS